MVGRISGTTGQLKYKINSGEGPEQNRFAEDTKESTEKMFSLNLVHFLLLK